MYDEIIYNFHDRTVGLLFLLNGENPSTQIPSVISQSVLKVKFVCISVFINVFLFYMIVAEKRLL